LNCHRRTRKRFPIYFHNNKKALASRQVFHYQLGESIDDPPTSPNDLSRIITVEIG
jgi:hypothetical protein